MGVGGIDGGPGLGSGIAVGVVVDGEVGPPGLHLLRKRKIPSRRHVKQVTQLARMDHQARRIIWRLLIKLVGVLCLTLVLYLLVDGAHVLGGCEGVAGSHEGGA